MIYLLPILILAIVQGITEFLPISSDGHLILTKEFLTATGQPLGKTQIPGQFLMVEIILHIGTLLSILVVYRKEVWELLTTNRRMIPLLILGTIPAAVLGLALKKLAGGVLENPYLTGVMLFLTGTLVIWGARSRPGERKLSDVTWQDALWIGTCQAFAVLPGLSRSGTTITAGLALGLNRQTAADFSFLLALPALTGAAVLELKDLSEAKEQPIPLAILALGAFCSFIVGIFALRWLIAWLRSGRFEWFGIWCYFAGTCLLLWLWLGKGLTG